MNKTYVGLFGALGYREFEALLGPSRLIRKPRPIGHWEHWIWCMLALDIRCSLHRVLLADLFRYCLDIVVIRLSTSFYMVV